jgi:outer membrane protein TolC
MKSICFTTIILFVSSLDIPGEERADTHAYPLEQILAIARSNAVQLKIIDTKTEAGYAEVAMYRSNAKPNITLGGGVSYVSQSYETQKMQQTLMLPLFGGSSDEIFFHLHNLGLIDTNSTDVQSYRNYLEYLQESQGSEINFPDRINGISYNWSLNLQQPLITFGKISSAIRLARMRDCTLKDMHRLEKDLFYLRVIQEFTAAYLAQWDVEISNAAVIRTGQTKKRLESEFAAGRAIKRDLLRIEAMLQGERVKLITSRSRLSTSLKRLLQTISFGDTLPIRLEFDESGTLYDPPPSSGPGSIQLSLKHNEAAMYKEQIRFLRSNFFPAINLVGSIYNQFMTIDTSGLVEDLVPSGTSSDQLQAMGELFDQANPKADKLVDTDFFNYSIGLQLTWNIYDGDRTRAKYRQAKLQAKQALLELEEMDKEQKIAIEESRNQISAVDSTIAAVKLQVGTAAEAYHQTEQDYKDGMTDYSTLLDFDNEYRTAARQLEGLKIQRVLALAQLRIAIGLPVYGEDE